MQELWNSHFGNLVKTSVFTGHLLIPLHSNMLLSYACAQHIHHYVLLLLQGPTNSVIQNISFLSYSNSIGCSFLNNQSFYCVVCCSTDHTVLPDSIKCVQHLHYQRHRGDCLPTRPHQWSGLLLQGSS